MASAWTDVTTPGGWAWERLAPGPELATVLAGVDLASLPGDARPSYLAAAARLEAWAQLLTCRALVAVSDAVLAEVGSSTPWDDDGTVAWVAEEIAAALHVATGTATNRLMSAERLVRTMPDLAREVEEGRLSVSQARAIADTFAILVDTPHLAAAMAAVLPQAPALPPARLRELAERTVVAIAPDKAAERRREARRHGADVIVWRDADAMATLAMKSEAPDAIALREIIHARALQLRDQSGQGRTLGRRTLGQWRVAAMMEAFGLLPISCATSDEETPEAPLPQPLHAQVKVVIDLPTLFGLASNPCHLDGYGPIDPDLARALAADGQWQRWIADPVTGHLLDEGDRRFPGERLARYIKARDTHCSHPSCGVRARHADIDHVPEYRTHRSTSADTLTTTCPKHNRSRDESGWTLTWTSPLGRRYRTQNSAHHGQGDGPTPS